MKTVWSRVGESNLVEVVSQDPSTQIVCTNMFLTEGMCTNMEKNGRNKNIRTTNLLTNKLRYKTGKEFLELVDK